MTSPDDRCPHCNRRHNARKARRCLRRLSTGSPVRPQLAAYAERLERVEKTLVR